MQQSWGTTLQAPMLQKITLTKLAAWISWSGLELNQGTSSVTYDTTVRDRSIMRHIPQIPLLSMHMTALRIIMMVHRI